MDGSLSTFDLLYNPRLNKGTAFSDEEREQHGLVGLLPDGVETPEIQLERLQMQIEQKPTALEKYIYLSELQDRNERLYYQLLTSDPAEYMPLVYTPTVGEACARWSALGSTPRRPASSSSCPCGRS
jgi:malate dehydrogenase (oxaloacetate-decarboxylating)(NADP+)